MIQKNKKILPKIQKNFSKFLTDESGKVTKKNALGISAAVALFSSIGQVGASHTSNANPSLPFPVSDPLDHTNGPRTFQFTQVTSATCNHASGIVNGHYSSIPTVNTTETIYDISSHGSHGSHGSHHSCGSGCW